MKRFLSIIAAMAMFQSVHAQISITTADMPVAGDTLRYSNASPVGTGINTGITGANLAWNYLFTPLSQGVDTYQLAVSVNPLYALTAGVSAYGYKIADSIPGLGAILPVSIQQLYDFFEVKSGPERFQAQSFGASIAGLPLATNYSPPDVLYFLPLTYNNYDSSRYALNLSFDSAGIKESGYRLTRADAWGTIQTPYYTTPIGCIRVRAEIHEIDSVSFSGISFGLPRVTIDYKWLVNGDHYPALWVESNLIAGNEIITSIKYRDRFQPSLNPIDTSSDVGVKNVSGKEIITAYPVPAKNGMVTISVPASWINFVVEVFDAQSKEVAKFNNEREINIQTLAAGQYIARVISGDKAGYVRIVR